MTRDINGSTTGEDLNPDFGLSDTYYVRGAFVLRRQLVCFVTLYALFYKLCMLGGMRWASPQFSLHGRLATLFRMAPLGPKTRTLEPISM